MITLSFLIGSNPTGKSKHRRSRTSRTPITRSKLYSQAHPGQQMTSQNNLNSPTFISPARCRNKASCFLWAAVRSFLAMRPFVFFELFAVLHNGYQARQSLLEPQGLLQRHRWHKKKLAEAATVPKEIAKQWLIKQTTWQIYLSALRYIPCPKFAVESPDKVNQADCHTTSFRMATNFTITRWPFRRLQALQRS